MDNKMLIDASHPEETRVVVLRDGRIEEFDYESAAKKLLRGNIYLAKVTRVEPSLQAAFIDYGGNRHGFLAFNEIHPDYYQIPVADRQALIRAEVEAERQDNDDTIPDEVGGHGSRGEEGETGIEEAGSGSVPWAEDDNGDGAFHDPVRHRDLARSEKRSHGEQSERSAALDAGRQGDVISWPSGMGGGFEAESDAGPADDADLSDAPSAIGLVENQGVEEIAPEPGNGGLGNGEPGNGGVDKIESVGSEDALEEVPERRRRPPRAYKIQEVTRRRQIMLVQVVKEERGNKGAALTTYLSLAGRYTVLMPNTGRGGGISRKITNAVDRKRLKELMSELEVPEGMGLIVRTAGASRSMPEIKRDFEYLLRVWESVRELTLNSTAPALVYEEGDLIKRSIRDLYSKDIEEIVVAGDVACKDAQDFMRMLMPGHSKNVKAYDEPEPIFTRYQIERQLNAMFSPQVTLRSGGYLVINQTEALVAIDINSGRSTREHSIEETALKTNIEASDEIARQLRLRDLAGLIVIDFIDMEERRNNRTVERRLKDALQFDRARIQVGRISHFGLMEMSRQRLRTGVLEGSTSQCPHCLGTGVIRSTESVALAVLRALEDALLVGPRSHLIANTSIETALFLLNSKRSFIKGMEDRHSITITVDGTEEIKGANFTIERTAAVDTAEPARRVVVQMDWSFEESQPEAAAESEGDANKRKRKRRRGRGDRGEGEDQRHDRPMNGNGQPERGSELSEQAYDRDQQPSLAGADDDGRTPDDRGDDDEGITEAGASGEGGAAEGREERSEAGSDRDGGRRRRRGRRGGKRNRRGPQDGELQPEPRERQDGGSAHPDMVAAGPLEPGAFDRVRSSNDDQPVIAAYPTNEGTPEPYYRHRDPVEERPSQQEAVQFQEPTQRDEPTRREESKGHDEYAPREPQPRHAGVEMPRHEELRSPVHQVAALIEMPVIPPEVQAPPVIGEPQPEPGQRRRGWWQRKLL